MNVIRIQGDAERNQGVYYEYDRDSIPLGEGGMGRIFQGYRVDDMSGGFRIPVAIKEIHESISRDPQLIERAMRESSIQIEHENLLRMYGFIANVEYDSMRDSNIVRYYMVMERLVGVNLDQIMNGVTTDKSGMQIPFAQEIYEMYTTNRDAADRAHHERSPGRHHGVARPGYIHRDIDPSNVMITIDNKVKLIDFGVCKHIDSSPGQDRKLTQAGSFIGKVSYAAPELALGDVEHQDRTTDIYALGIFMYQLSVGRLPFSGSNQEVLSAHVSKKVPVNDIVNKDLRRIVEKATQKSQLKRYSTAAEFIVDLEHMTFKRTSSGGNTAAFVPPAAEGSSGSLTLFWILAPVCGFVIGLIVKFIVVLR